MATEERTDPDARLNDPDVLRSETAFQRLCRLTELPLALLALLIVPALILEERSQNTGWREAATIANWIVWLAFVAEYLAKLALSPARLRFVRTAWFDLAIIVLSPPFWVPAMLQGTRAVRVVRILRLLRFVRAGAVAAMGLRFAADALRHRRFHYVAFTATVIISLGAMCIFAVESGHNKAIQSVGDAFWWAIVTTTTVGYGDVSPVTPMGRVIAVVLMFVGIGFIGVFTATITSFFLGSDSASEQELALERRLDRIEEKLDLLLQDRAQPTLPKIQSQTSKKS